MFEVIRMTSLKCSIYPKYLDRNICANSADPDQTAPKEQFDLGLHCLPLHQNISDTLLGTQMTFANFRYKFKCGKELTVLNS